MIEKQINSHDGIVLNYAVSEEFSDKPCIVLILPFGFKTHMADIFFDFFDTHYQLVTWETRTILEDSDRNLSEGELSIDNHVQDVKTILGACRIKNSIFVGYCSGAGIAIAAANRYPQLIKRLILVHGEFVLLNEMNCTTQFSMEIDTLLSLAAQSENHLTRVFDKIQSEKFDSNTNIPHGIDLPYRQKKYFRRYAANYLEYKSVDFIQLAKQVNHKTLLMCGEMDAQSNVRSSERIRSLIPSSEIFIDPNADHYGILRSDSTTLTKIWNYLYEH